MQIFLVRMQRAVYHGMPSKPCPGPSGLKIKTARERIDVQHLTRKKQPRLKTAFEGLEIHLFQGNAPSGDKLFLEGAFVDDLKTRFGQSIR